MTINNLKATVYGRLEAIAAAEKITRVELGALSRELLLYVPDSQDIDIVNRLIGVLTPVNRKVAILYFKHFLPWEVEETAEGKFSRFGKKMDKPKQVERRTTAIKEWLADEGNTIWTWADANVEVKQKDLAGGIQRAIKAALKGHEASGTEPLTPEEVVQAIFLAGIKVEHVLSAVAPNVEKLKQAQEGAEDKDEAAAVEGENLAKAAA